MFQTAILVLLYNKEIVESNTITSLIKSGVSYSDAKVVIWNNGPNELKSQDCSALSDLGYTVTIIETINNESLAVIYNRFLQETEAEKYILLDDDSELSKEFINASAASQSCHLSLPIISSEGKVQYPSIDRKRYSSATKIYPNSKVTTIGSGLVIGDEIVEALTLKYGEVFDERFYLYGVDTTFCLRLSESDLVKSVQIIPGFDHSLSRLGSENVKMTTFRRIERSYERGLKLRYYVPLPRAIFLLLKTGMSVLQRLCLGKQYQVSFLYVLKAFVSGKHYRDDA